MLEITAVSEDIGEWKRDLFNFDSIRNNINDQS